MDKEYITHSSKETENLGKKLISELEGRRIICLSGELGAGKTTFTKGLLDGLGAEGPFTSPTFVVMKHYEIGNPEIDNIKNAYHMDAYRINEEDLGNLGWEEITANPENVIIVEWAERVEKAISEKAIHIDFFWDNENERKIVFKNI